MTGLRLRAAMHDDRGMTLVEMLVAALLLLVLMGASLSTVSLTIVSSRQARATSVASATANAQVEEYRSFTYDTIALDDDDASSPPNTHDGLPVIKADCDTCPRHKETITDETGTYSVTRWVLGVDDPADNTGPSGADADGETVDYKRLVIDVEWSHARSGSTTITTNIRRDGTATPPPPQGVSFELVDESGERLEDIEDEFPVKATFGGIEYTDAAAEGFVTIFGIPEATTGQCQVDAPNFLWQPLDTNPKACSVTADTVTNYKFTFRFTPCDTDLGQGTSVVTVEDGVGGVNDAAVTVKQRFGAGTVFGPESTGTDGTGTATFANLPSGIYDVTVTHATKGTVTGELCSRPDPDGGATTVNYSLAPSPSPSPTTTPSPSPSPSTACSTPLSTNEFEFKWRIRNDTSFDRSYRLRIRKVGGTTDFIDGPKVLGKGSDHEFKKKVRNKFDCFDVIIECEQAPGTWQHVFTDANRKAANPSDSGKNDVKLHEINDIPNFDKDLVTTSC